VADAVRLIAVRDRFRRAADPTIVGVAYQPIENHGVIGNMRTAALVAMNGSIDWYCFPAFDSPSVFAALLDEVKGGCFSIAPATEHTARKQFYWPDTNVLVTRFLSEEGVGQITDFMPVGLTEKERGFQWLVRRVSVSRGSMRFRAVCRPAFNYARSPHRLEASAGGARFLSDGLALELCTEAELRLEDGAATSEFTLTEGETVSFVLRPAAEDTSPLTEVEAQALFESTVEYWRRWLSACTYTGRWREMVQRSALALKLLTYEPTGAMVAAVTCSLPEDMGGARNWDYRYMWIRDAAFTMYALMRIGFVEEAGAFMRWLDDRCRQLPPDGSLQLMYSIDGRPMEAEEILDHFEGYRGSRPVRVGNDASRQLQLDIYGELMDSVYLYNKYGSPISNDLWQHLRRITNWVCDHWKETDEGIWEVRGGRRDFVYSKLMCWVAIDRSLRLASKRSLPSDWQRWMEVRDEIYADIMARGWSEERKAFVQSYGSSSLDASVLMMPLVFFVSPTDPRMLSTIDAINRSPSQGGLVSNSLVYRYDVVRTPDGIRGDEGTFNICTFWLVEAMVRAAGRTRQGRLREARLMFEQMLGYANHLGLYAEETGPTGEHLGNFPQAFTHLGLISAAANLDRALGEARR
jgi:GH15 family glucan-1,4-alpha-glucosidase